MRKVSELQVQYVTNDQGKKTAIILPLKNFKNFLKIWMI